jgi:small GTP-binding protein
MNETPISNEISYEILKDDYSVFDINFKVIVLGNAGVGKTCLTSKAIKDEFLPNHQTTIGFEFFSFIIRIENKIIKIQIWDTCGQEIYRSLITNFYKKSSLAFIMYAIDDRDSFDDIENWLKDLKSNSCPDCKIFLIGNKADLEENRKVSKEEGEDICKKYGFQYFTETSAKTGFNAKEIFVKCAITLYKDFIKLEDEFGIQKHYSLSSKSTYIDSKNKSKNENSKLKKQSKQKKKNDKEGCC